MWRLSDTTFMAPACGHPGWAVLRQQLGTARTVEAFGDVPLMASMVAELDSIEEAMRTSGSAPFDEKNRHSWRSLMNDLVSAQALLGPTVAALTREAVDAAGALGVDTDPPPWDKLVAVTKPLRTALQRGDAVVAGFDDALAAAEAAGDPGGYLNLNRRVDDFRAICEMQGRGWQPTAREITQHLTEPDAFDRPLQTGDDRQSPPPQELLQDLRSWLRELPVEEEWAVWIGTLAGPGAGRNERFPSLVSGPIAVCGLPCGDDVGEWLEAARAALTRAFTKAGIDVPADVKALGEPVRWHGHEWETAAELWGSLAKPSSFVARVAVRAHSSEHAISKAKTTLRALYGLEDARVGRDLRYTARVWHPEGHWASQGLHAADYAEGQILAAQTALRAAHVWATDLRSPLSDSEMERLAARSLVRDPDASLDVRLARAFSSLESMKPPGLALEQVSFRLWYHDAWDRAYRLADDAIRSVSGFFRQASVADEAGRRALNALQAEMNTVASNTPLAERFRLAERAAEMLHPDDPHRRFAKDSSAAMGDASQFSAQRKAHAAAFARARRHRNLVVHGHRLAAAAAAPSVEFLARLLEVAIGAEAARADQTRTACLGSLHSVPEVRPAKPTTFGALIDAVPVPDTVVEPGPSGLVAEPDPIRDPAHRLDAHREHR